MSLEARIIKDFGSFKLDVDFAAGDESLALLGASGCGKSLTLKCIAGIIRPDEGRISLDGRVLFDSEKHIDLSPQQRKTGLLFQNYALFPNMTVLQNLRCGAKREKDKKLREEKIQELAQSFGLSELLTRLPSQLSGGQQQRVALARILLSEPEILLLDEPFSALDSHLRFALEGELRKLIRDFKKTVILVSHDRDEVYRLSDRIAVMDRGRIQVSGTREQVFAQPLTRAAAKLTGCKNISRLKWLEGNRALALDWNLELELPERSGAKFLGIRMHDVHLGPGENSCSMIISQELQNPFSSTLFLLPEGGADVPLGMELSPAERVSIKGEKVTISIPKDKILLLNE